MKYILSLAALAFFLHSSAQTGTAIMPGNIKLKKGFYRSYQEYLNNAPSVTTPFIATYFTRSAKDSTILRAEYSVDYKDPVAIPPVRHVWGFCDGKDVFVKYAPAFIAIEPGFWKLECLGPHPYFTYSEKGPILIGPALATLTSVAAAEIKGTQYEDVMLNEKGKAVELTIARLKKWLAPEPDLLVEFTTVSEPYAAAEVPNSEEIESPKTYAERIRLIKEYLLKFNQRRLQKSY